MMKSMLFIAPSLDLTAKIIMCSFTAILLQLAILATAQQPQYPPPFPPTPILPSSINYAPSVTPNVLDSAAPNPQTQCPGYHASNVQESANGLTADLNLAGAACDVYGNDIAELVLDVQYQSKQRLAVRIFPKFLAPSNRSLYILDDGLTPEPEMKSESTRAVSDLDFQWTNTPSFQFQVSRAVSGEILFSTYGRKIIFEDQFLELHTAMVPDYNVYGLAGTQRGFRIPNNYTQTFWNAYNLNNDLALDVNGHDVHPMYLETRYSNGSSLSHGVYARNAHGQDWILSSNEIVYRTIGGSFDFYFLSGPTPKEVISQYQVGIVKTPILPPYWALGFHQVRWSYQNWTNLQDVIDAYAAAGIQLEGIMNDLDYLKLNRDFTNNPGHYDATQGIDFLDKLHAAGQHYMPILDPNIYVPNPANESDAYPTYNRGAELNAYIRNGENFYTGVEWPGFSVFPDFLTSSARQFWTEQITAFHQKLAFDGFWLDVSDATSFCTGSCGEDLVENNPIHVPFALPGDPNSSVAVDYRYPEFFGVTNTSEAASASTALASQSAAYPTLPPEATPTPVYARTLPTQGVRNLNFPPYAINNNVNPGNSLVKQVIAPNATHNDGPYNSTEYELHNLYGHLSARATYDSLVATYDNKRPFFIARSTFAGSGAFAGHWGGDGISQWWYMYFGISQALQFAIAGIPYFGVETCGFNANADMELCTRWMQLSAWFPLYRNHNSRNTIAQEAYRWSTTIKSTRTIMDIRYCLLPYTYTLFHQAHGHGAPVMRALAWEFPNDESLKAVETQFMSGPAILITPVLVPLATTVQGVFPGVADGVRWYDWYTLTPVGAAPGENKTLDAPLVHQPVHVRGGYIIPMQKAGNTTRTSRQSAWSLLVALDAHGRAEGGLYLDDGVSLVVNATKHVRFSFEDDTLTATAEGTYEDGLALANVTFAGIGYRTVSVDVSLDGLAKDGEGIKLLHEDCGALRISGLEKATASGVWKEGFKLVLLRKK